MAFFSIQIPYLSLLVGAGPSNICQIRKNKSENTRFVHDSLRQRFFSFTGFSDTIGTIAVGVFKVFISVYTISLLLCAQFYTIQVQCHFG